MGRIGAKIAGLSPGAASAKLDTNASSHWEVRSPILFIRLVPGIAP